MKASFLFVVFGILVGGLQAGSLCVMKPTPAYEAELLGVVQYGDGVEVVVKISPPADDIISIQVVVPEVLELPDQVPALSVRSVVTAREERGQQVFLEQYFRQDVGLKVLYNVDNPVTGGAFDFALLDSGWIESQVLGWVYHDPSGWVYQGEFGWVWPHEVEVFELNPDALACGERGLWFWRDETRSWWFTASGLYPEWVYSEGQWVQLN